MNNNINLVKAFLQVDGKCNLTDICGNYMGQGGIQFSGWRKNNIGENRRIVITMDKDQVEIINKCSSIEEVYLRYKEIGYFNE